jgi:hypothetical protein
MLWNTQLWKDLAPILVLLSIAAGILFGCGDDGPAIEARAQTLSFSAAPALTLGDSVKVEALASSGLAVRYTSITPDICTVATGTGATAAIAVGLCVVAADQPGDTRFAPARQVRQNLQVLFDPHQTLSFDPPPVLSFGGTARVSATASSGLAVIYSSQTPAVCTVDSRSGLVTNLTLGDCLIAADQDGLPDYLAAPQVVQTLTVSLPGEIKVPDAPREVSATAGGEADRVSVSVGATDSGGSPLTGYLVSAYRYSDHSPTAISAAGVTSPLMVSCPSSCAGYVFTVKAVNSLGEGAESSPAEVVTLYEVTATFLEPDTQPKNSIFIGTFSLNSSSQTVLGLHGILSESMTGGKLAYPNDNMNWLALNNQLSSLYDPTLGGFLVTAFLLETTHTFSDNPAFNGTDGWTPGTGSALYAGFPGTNPGNAYVRIFVNPDDPTAPLNQSQLGMLAYADCSPSGMMGSTCMTGTTLAGYGTLGSMSGYPVSQNIAPR